MKKIHNKKEKEKLLNEKDLFNKYFINNNNFMINVYDNENCHNF